MRRSYAVIFVVLFSFVFGTISLLAGARGALPDVALTALDGTTTSSAAIPLTGHWLLIYAEVDGRTADALLRSLTKAQYPGLSTRTVVIVGGTVAQTKMLMSKYPDLGDARWYAGPVRTDWSRFVRGTPVLLGMDQQSISWTLNGNLGVPSTFPSTVTAWLQN